MRVVAVACVLVLALPTACWCLHTTVCLIVAKHYCLMLVRNLYAQTLRHGLHTTVLTCNRGMLSSWSPNCGAFHIAVARTVSSWHS